MTAEMTHLRSDARDNRDKILEVAREVFATEGLEVSMREIARRAQVGPATLYRRFPTKEALVTEAFEEQMCLCRYVVDEAVADPDAWRGFCTVIEKVFELHARDRGFTAAFMSAYPKALDFSKNRAEVMALLAGLVVRAKESGELRSDVGVEDLVMVIMANSGIRAGSTQAAVAASRRFAALAIEAFRAGDRAVLPPPARLSIDVLLRS